jgi:hypothetical protein
MTENELIGVENDVLSDTTGCLGPLPFVKTTMNNAINALNFDHDNWLSVGPEEDIALLCVKTAVRYFACGKKKVHVLGRDQRECDEVRSRFLEVLVTNPWFKATEHETNQVTLIGGRSVSFVPVLPENVVSELVIMTHQPSDSDRDLVQEAMSKAGARMMLFDRREPRQDNDDNEEGDEDEEEE